MKRLFANVQSLVVLALAPFFPVAWLLMGIPRSIRFRPRSGWLLLISVVLILILPLESSSSVSGYVHIAAQEWPLLILPAIAWLLFGAGDPRQGRWFAVPTISYGVTIFGMGIFWLPKIMSAPDLIWTSLTVAGLTLSGLGLVWLSLRELWALAQELLPRSKQPTRREKEPSRTQGEWTDTEIAEFRNDHFSSKAYAGVLARRAVQTDTPLVIGIFGRWGSGKTSLMRLMQNELEHPQTGETVPRPTLWVNVWQLSNQEQLWNAFLQSLLTQVHDRLPWHRFGRASAQP